MSLVYHQYITQSTFKNINGILLVYEISINFQVYQKYINNVSIHIKQLLIIWIVCQLYITYQLTFKCINSMWAIYKYNIKQLLRMLIVYQQYITYQSTSAIYQISNDFEVYQYYVGSVSDINQFLRTFLDFSSLVIGLGWMLQCPEFKKRTLMNWDHIQMRRILRIWKYS